MHLLNLKDSINQLSFGNPKENERVQNILTNEGVTTLEQLCRMSKAALQSIGKIGDVTVERIINNLEKCGLHLGMTAFECNTYTRCRNQILNVRKNMTEEFGRMMFGDNDNVRIFDRDPLPEDYDEEKEDDGECCHHLNLNIHNNLQLPKKEAEPVDWEARFYDIAKEEFLRQNRVFSCEETRVERAVLAAKAFIEAMKEFQLKNKSI